MTEYFLRSDPALPRAIAAAAWDSFLRALEETTPEVIGALKVEPLTALRAVAEEYGQISTFEFGAITCHSGDRPSFNPFPLADLASLIRNPSMERPSSGWPPSATFWEPSIQRAVFRLSGALREWAKPFLDGDDLPHLRLLGAALNTMRTWLADPQTLNIARWLGHPKVIMRHRIETPHLDLIVNLWNPTEETEDEFRNRIKKTMRELSQWSREHIKEVKPQFVKYDTKRNPEHYDWAALRLVRDMTYPEITEMWVKKSGIDDLDEGTVRKGVRAALRILGFKNIKSHRK